MWSLVTEYLLLENDELEIKDLGKFSATNTKAQIDKENNKLIPAGRKFSFVSIGENTSANFITFISKTLKINRPEALKLIETKVQEAKEKLKAGEKVILPQVGYLFSPDREKITLVQTTTFSLHPDNFGSADIPIPPTTQSQEKNSSKTKKKDKKQLTVKAKTKQKPIPKQKKVKERKTINWTAIIRTTVILTAIAAVIILMIAFYKPIYELGKQLLVSKPDTDQTVTPKAQPITKQTSTTTPKQISETTSVSTTKPIKKQPSTSQDSQILASFSIKANVPLGENYKKYYPIVGSFINRDNAEKFRQQLINEGFTNAIILSASQDRHRVSIGGYDTLSQVANARDLYLQKHPGAGIWLLINQPNGN